VVSATPSAAVAAVAAAAEIAAQSASGNAEWFTCCRGKEERCGCSRCIHSRRSQKYVDVGLYASRWMNKETKQIDRPERRIGGK